MNVYDEFYPVAVELLNEFGTAATLTRSAAKAAPTAAQKFSKAERDTHPAVQIINTIAVVPDPETASDDQGRVITYQTVLMLDQPVKGDTLKIGSATYLVGDVMTTAPQGKAIYYQAIVTS